jgi:hypothetical protein
MWMDGAVPNVDGGWQQAIVGTTHAKSQAFVSVGWMAHQ